MNPSDVSVAVRTAALSLGFDRVGVVTEGVSGHLGRLSAWLDNGHHGGMAYLARPDTVARRADLKRTLPGFQSAIVVAHEYGDASPALGGTSPHGGLNPSRGVVARYARGRDYHYVMTEKLQQLAAEVSSVTGRQVATSAYVDTGPLLERELAQRAGLGWFGRNTMLIHPRHGSYFFLGVLLTDAAMEASSPFDRDHCGSCRSCLEACPTGALLGRDEAGAPIMDARRCISYLTIELKGPIPAEFREALGNRVFGCDICQEVCPFNERFSKASEEPGYRADAAWDGPSLIELAESLLSMSEKGYARTFARSPLLRARRKGLLRNVCVALGNWASEEAVPVLTRALGDKAPLVRGHAAWALGQEGSATAHEALDARAQVETESWVLEEIRGAGSR
ncbi:MAG: tRNA epoxyqueuosine(34) reductase QueG [Longimicrobiales bacterium]